jgi:heme-degrading monooxygenase HmoA
MYVSVSRLRVPAERSDELVSAFRDRAHLVDDVDGFVDLEVWRSDRARSHEDGVEVWMVSRWDSKEQFTSYMRSDAHRASHDRVDTDLHHAIRLERLEQLHDTYEVVAR